MSDVDQTTELQQPEVRRLRRRAIKKLNYADFSRLSQVDNDNICSADAEKLKQIFVTKKFALFPPKEPAGGGSDVTGKWLKEEGLDQPILVRNKQGLGLEVPDPTTFGVREVSELVGPDTSLNVMEVSSQSILTGCRLGDWADYYEDKREGKKILNVISLEFSGTALGDRVKSPQAVRDIDWIDKAWPASSVNKPGCYPKTQYYCLMSVAGAWTDFHIDMGGSSVWYHVLKGEKTFLFIPPTPENLVAYEEWTTSADQGRIFFGDVVPSCYKVEMIAGNTMFIPSGWIHAVFTPIDSLAFGGNYLNSISIPMQITIHDLEIRSHIPSKFCYPFFKQLFFCVASSIVRDLRAEQRQNVSRLVRREREGLPAMVAACRAWILNSMRNTGRCPVEWSLCAADCNCSDAGAMLDELALLMVKTPPPISVDYSTEAEQSMVTSERPTVKISVKPPAEAGSEELQLTPAKKTTRTKGSLQICVKLPQAKGVKLEENTSTQIDAKQLPIKRKRRGKYIHSQFVEDVGQEKEEDWDPELELGSCIGEEALFDDFFESDDGGNDGSGIVKALVRRRQQKTGSSQTTSGLATTGGLKTAPRSKVSLDRGRATTKNRASGKAILSKKFKI
eukprot:463495_1